MRRRDFSQQRTGYGSFEGLQRLLKRESGDGCALADNLEDNPICTVTFDASIPCLLVRWKAYATSTQIRYIHECLIRLIKKHRVSRILGDDADLANISTVDQHWIVRNWVPRAIGEGLKVAASNKPRDYHAQASVNRILSALPADLTIRSFESLGEARDWLRSAYQAGTYRIAYRRFKSGGEPINTFAFWSPEPDLAHFKQLARVALRAFWKVEGQTLSPFISRQPLPELIVITTESGEEVCRWSLQDEIALLTDRTAPSRP
jgi:hypothetical protein